MSVVLPTPESNPGKAEWSEVYANDKALKEGLETLEGEFKAAVKPVTWYTPKVIATEESRTNTAFGTLTTADEIKNVVLPENGLLAIGYTAAVKSSVENAGRATIFIGSNQLKTAGGENEAQTQGTAFNLFSTVPGGLFVTKKEFTRATTGEALANSESVGGLCYVFAAAGTYNISVKFKASSGSVTAKERKLWVFALGA